jgi:hypothetical protein
MKRFYSLILVFLFFSLHVNAQPSEQKANELLSKLSIEEKISLLGYKIIEVPISYKGRDYKEGKKISFFDGLHAIFTIIKYRIKS